MMIEVWKILNEKTKVRKDSLIQVLEAGNTRETRATSSGLNLVIPRARLETRKNFFSCRVPKAWNLLPENIKLATSIKTFKTLLDEWIYAQRT